MRIHGYIHDVYEKLLHCRTLASSYAHLLLANCTSPQMALGTGMHSCGRIVV